MRNYFIGLVEQSGGVGRTSSTRSRLELGYIGIGILRKITKINLLKRSSCHKK